MCSLKSPADIGRIRTLAAGEGLEIVETHGLRYAFSPHRHDDYVIGLTTHGVQSFRYRRKNRAALPGQAFVIHPDELHDGRPGTESGYGYRAAYIAPSLIGDALDGRPLPFVGDVVGDDRELKCALGELLSQTDQELGDPAGSIARLADTLARMAGTARLPLPGDVNAASRIRDHLEAGWHAGVSMAEIEAEHGLDRFAAARLFRRHFGVSPHRFQVLRRLQRVKAMIVAGANLADAAAASGFADQSHMTRQYKQAFGITPGQWRQLLN